MNNYLITTICFLFLLFAAPAQHAVKIEELKNKLNEPIHDTERVKTLLKIAYETMEQGNGRLSLEWAKKSFELSQKIGYKKIIPKIYNQIANSYVTLSDYPKGIEYHQKSLQASIEQNSKSGIAASYNNIGIIYYNLSDFPKTIEYFQKSLKIQEELNNERWEAATIGNIAVVYSELQEDSLAMLYQKRSFDMHQKMGNKTDMVASLNHLGKLYQKKNDLKTALNHHQKALAIAVELDEKEGMKNTYSNLGELYLAMHDANQAIAMFFKSISFSDEAADKKSMADVYTSLAAAYRKTGKNEEAISYLKKALVLAQSIGALKEQKEASDALYDLYKERRDFETAMRYHEQARKLNDSIFNTSKNESLNSLKTQFALDRQELDLKAKAATALQKTEEEKARQQTIIYIAMVVLLLVLVFSYILFKRFQITQKQNKIIESQKIIVEQKNKEITDSIVYTKRIQQAIIPTVESVKGYFPESFVYFKPKDIIAGDFYWMHYSSDATYFAVADCTGHGVPGAMVSIVCCNALNSAVKEFGLKDTGAILDKTRQLVIETFEKSGEDIKDGMDISLLKVSTTAGANEFVKLEWSGANNALWYITGGEFTIVPCDKQPIGNTDNFKPFTTRFLELPKETNVYLFTDGFADQFGGPKGKKLKYKSLIAFLKTIHHLPMAEQHDQLNRFFIDWKGELEQVDDVSIAGIRFK